MILKRQVEELTQAKLQISPYENNIITT